MDSMSQLLCGDIVFLFGEIDGKQYVMSESLLTADMLPSGISVFCPHFLPINDANAKGMPLIVLASSFHGVRDDETMPLLMTGVPLCHDQHHIHLNVLAGNYSESPLMLTARSTQLQFSDHHSHNRICFFTSETRNSSSNFIWSSPLKTGVFADVLSRFGYLAIRNGKLESGHKDSACKFALRKFGTGFMHNRFGCKLIQGSQLAMLPMTCDPTCFVHGKRVFDNRHACEKDINPEHDGQDERVMAEDVTAVVPKTNVRIPPRGN